MNRHAKAPSAFTFGRKVALVLVLAAMSLLALAPAAFAGKIVDRVVSGTTTTGTTQGLFNSPKGIAINDPGVADASTDPLGASTNGYVYVVDDNNHRIQVFGADDSFKFMFGRGVQAGGDGAQICDSSETPCQGGTTFLDDEAGEFDNPQGIAINQSNGHLYVRDRDNRRVQEFEADGDFVRAFGWDVVASGPGNDVVAPLNEFEVCVAANGDVCKIGTTGANGGQFATTNSASTGIAVDPAAPHNVFVADPVNRRVQEFEADGDFVRLWGWDVVNTLQPGDVGTSNFEICSSTVAGVCKGGNTSGFSNNEDGRFGQTQPVHLAIDGTSGFLYASDSNLSNRVMAFDTDEVTNANLVRPALAVATITGTAGTASTSALDVEQATGTLLVARASTVIGVLEIANPSTTPTHADTHYAGSGLNPAGIALHPGSDDLYVASGAPATGHRLFAADDDGAFPASATILPATNVEAESATLTGAVNPGGGVLTTFYRFQYSKDGISWTDASAPIDVGTGNTDVPVQVGVTGLEPNTLYRVRIATQKAFGNPLALSPELTLLTDAPLPTAETLPPSTRTIDSAQITARIDANGSPTTYQFQWGATNKYGNLIPIPAGNAGQGSAPVIISERIAGLKPNTTYHYRVIVNSPQGTATGADLSFTTRADVASGPERVYEMITPPFKVIRAAVSPVAAPRNNPNIGIPSLDGEAMAWTTPFFALQDDVGAPALGDRRIIRRTPQGWINETMNTLRFIDSSPTLLRQTVTGSSGDLRTVAWTTGGGLNNSGGLLPSEGLMQSRLYTRRSGTGVEGFNQYLSNPARQVLGSGYLLEIGGIVVGDVAALNDDGTVMGRSGYYRGLAEDYSTAVDEDPSDEQQLTGQPLGVIDQPGGTTAYVQRAEDPDAMPTAPKDLVNECTGSGPDATLIPARIGSGLATDTIGVQSCAESSGTAAATGTATLNNNSTSVTSVSVDTGAFAIGQIVSGAGIPHGTRITGVAPSTLTLSTAASTGALTYARTTVGSPVLTRVMPIGAGALRVGQALAGPGLPGGVTIVEVGDGTLTLSADATTSTNGEYTATGPPSLSGVSITADAQHVTSVRGARIGGSSMKASGGAGFDFPMDSTEATAVSNDGSRVFFQSPDQKALGIPGVSCSTATGSSTDCVPQLFVRQYKSNGDPIVRWVSRAQGVGTQQIGMLGSGANFQGASRDGSVVYFKTNAPLLPSDPNGGTSIVTGTASTNSWDLYRYELPADLDEDPANGTLTRISGGPNGGADPSTNFVDGEDSPLRFHSDDGRRAYFLTTSPIAGTDATPPAGGGTAPGGSVGNTSIRNLYLFDDNETGADKYKFIARLPYSPSSSSLAACASSGGMLVASVLYSTVGRTPGVVGNCFRGTPDGRYVTFHTPGALTVDDSDGSSDIYLYDAVEDELIRVTKPLAGASPYRCNGSILVTPLAEVDSCYGDFSSVGTWGSGGNGAAGFYDAARGWGGMRYSNIAVDDNGVVSVFFESQSRLAPEDTNGDYFDVYEWRNGELSLVSPGNTNDDAWFSGNSVDSEDVFFYTSQRIDPREIDPADFDIYDARVGGGIPYTPPPTPCDVLAFGCEVEASAAPQARGAASTGFSGEGNLAQSKPKPDSKRCTKGKVRRKGKCVKRAKRAKRAANQSGRAGR